MKTGLKSLENTASERYNAPYSFSSHAENHKFMAFEPIRCLDLSQLIYAQKNMPRRKIAEYPLKQPISHCGFSDLLHIRRGHALYSPDF
jgi:hypothetical protein